MLNSLAILRDVSSNDRSDLGVELIQNGDFESHPGVGGRWGLFDDITGWGATEDRIEIQQRDYGTGNTRGNSVVELDGRGNATIEQNPDVPEAGVYQFSVDFSPRGTNFSTNGFGVRINGETVAEVYPTETGFQTLVLEVELPEGSNKIEIFGLGVSDGIGTVIDNVSLRQIPDAAGTTAAEAVGIDAVDNELVVAETEASGDVEVLESGALSVLSNDTQDGAPFQGQVSAVNGVAANVGEFVQLAGGGRVKINADGTVDFDADGDGDGVSDFEALGNGDSQGGLSIEYTITSTVGGGTGEDRTLDFNNLALRQDISDAYEGVTISAVRRDELGDNNPDNAARIYNTAVSGRDNDLQASVDGDLTNVLIIQEDNGSDTAPDDNRNGGVVRFDFDEAQRVRQVDLIDTEERDNTRPALTFFFADGSSNTIQLAVTGNQEATRQVFNGAEGVANVIALEFEFIGSAGIDNLVIADEASAVEISDTAVLNITVLGEGDPSAAEIDAVDDALEVLETEPAGDLETLENNTGSVLANDTQDGAPFQGQVSAVNGVAANVGEFVQLAGGGRVKINADGTVDFDADGDGDGVSDFEALGNGDSQGGLSIEYTITSTVGGGTGEDRTLDFNNLALRQDISDAYEGVTISAVRRDELGDNNPDNAARIYNTAVSGRDNDLQASVDGDLTNVLIIQEDNGSDTAPDDNRNGGVVRFDFDEAQRVRQVDLIDTEERDNTRPALTFFFADGSSNTIQLAVTGNQEATRQVFNGAEGVANVIALEFEFIGSAGIDNLVIADEASAVEISDTAVLNITVLGENVLSDGDEETRVGEDAGLVALTNVLANTVDPETGDPTVISVAGDPGNLGASLAGSNGGLFVINADGTASFDTNGAFEALGNGETAVTSIEYAVTDAAGDVDVSTYTVIVEGENVLADGDEETRVDEDAGLVALTNVLANTVDPETGDPTVISVAGDTGNLGASLAGSNGGLFVINADGTASFDTNGAFDDLEDGESAVTSITYTVEDAAGDTDVSTYTVIVDGETPDPANSLSGTIITSGPGSQSVSFIIDHSFAMFRNAATETTSDPNGDGLARVIDSVLEEIVDRVSGLDADQPVHIALVGDTALSGTVTTTAGEIAAAQAAGTLPALLGNALAQADGTEVAGGLNDAVDFTLGLESARDFLTTPSLGFPPNGADEDEIIIITASDGTDGFDFVTGDPTTVRPLDAILAELTDADGIDATINVVAINTGIEGATIDATNGVDPATLFDPRVLVQLDSDGVVGNVDATDDFGLDDILENGATRSAGEVVSVSVGGTEFSVLDGTLIDTNPAADVFEFDLTDIVEDPSLGVVISLSTDDDPNTIERAEVVFPDVDPSNPESFSFELIIEPDPIITGA